jgi:hypothetical protein
LGVINFLLFFISPYAYIIYPVRMLETKNLKACFFFTAVRQALLRLPDG